MHKYIKESVWNFQHVYINKFGEGDSAMEDAARIIFRELEWAYWNSYKGRGTKHNIGGVVIYLPKMRKYDKSKVLSNIVNVIHAAFTR